MKSLEAGNSNQPNEQSTPRRHAADLLKSVKVTPNQERIETLAPYCETMERIAKAPTAIKKNLFKPRGKRRRTGCTKILSSKVGLSRDYIFNSRNSKFMRKSIARAEKLMVTEFLKRADNSYELPGKKDQVRGKGKFGLVDTLSNLHAKFQMENAQVSMSLAKFCKARPSNVKLIEWTARRTCLCQIHANIALLCKGSNVLPMSSQDMCKLDEEAIRTKLQNLPERVHFKKWERTVMQFDGRVIKKMKLLDKVLEREAFVTEVLTQMKEFRPHCERVGQIYGELQHLKANLKPMADAMVQLDFAENWTTKYQDEVSACYYNNKQVTIHPMVTYYKDIDENIRHVSYVGISSETTHTAPTIMAFIKAVISYIKVLLPNLTIVHFVSDSPSSQYRNRTMCAIVAQFFKMFAVKATWTWLEAGHGKGPCDGVGGSIKKTADNIVKSGQVVQDVSKLCEVLHGASIQARVIEVSRDRIAIIKEQLNTWQIPSVTNITATHSISCTGNGEHLMKRALPCFKSCCYTPGGVFHHACQGWTRAFSGPLICPHIDDPSVNHNAPTTMEVDTVPPATVIEVNTVPPTTAREVNTIPPNTAMEVNTVPPTTAIEVNSVHPTTDMEVNTTPTTAIEVNTIPPTTAIVTW